MKSPRLRRLCFEPLETRRVLSLAPCAAPDCVAVELIPEVDQFGFQIGTVQAYEDPGGTRVTFGIYDTGASVATFSATDQLLLELTSSPIPRKVVGGAEASAIGGTIVGDVSQAGTLIADGLHAVSFSNDLDLTVEFAAAARAEGVQAFVGTAEGSPYLPTITGTPIHNPSSVHPDGVAALVELGTYELDFGALFPELPEFQDIVIHLPDLRFVPPNTRLDPADDGSTTPAFRIPLSLMGSSNHENPGDQVTSSPNPVQTSVALYAGERSSGGNTLLFDTGAQVTVVSTEIAEQLQLDLANPETAIEVFGAGGGIEVPGFTLDALELPRDDNADGTPDGTLRFTDVPIYVLDFSSAVDGILGTNLFNGASSLLYDPFDTNGPSLQAMFLTERTPPPADPEAAEALALLGEVYPVFTSAAGGQLAPGFRMDPHPGWQNPVARHDVNNDGRVAPSDVLTLFNLLNRDGSHALPDPPVRDSAEPLFFDVNGDGRVTPVDPLAVINVLNQPPELPEAEWGVVATEVAEFSPVRAPFPLLQATEPGQDFEPLAGRGASTVPPAIAPQLADRVHRASVDSWLARERVPGEFEELWRDEFWSGITRPEHTLGSHMLSHVQAFHRF